VRAREDARGDLMRARHRLSKLLLRHERVYEGSAGRSPTTPGFAANTSRAVSSPSPSTSATALSARSRRAATRSTERSPSALSKSHSTTSSAGLSVCVASPP
jgi:hypothetical protein